MASNYPIGVPAYVREPERKDEYSGTILVA